MPKLDYKNNSNIDLYTSMYEQYYLKNSPIKKVKKVKKVIRKKKTSNIKKAFRNLILLILFFFILPFSYKNFGLSIYKHHYKNSLNVNFESILYPTHNYLYKDLFLGKYPIKDINYEKSLMIDIPENYERTALKNRLISLAQEYPNIHPAIYVWEYNGKSFVDINANVLYPAASIIKVPILIEMFRNIEQGKFSLNDTIVLEDFYRAEGSGKLKYSQGGVSHTMDNLARTMIEISDNSSTNMIMAKIGGMPELNRAIKRWGLKNTRINNWLPDLDGTNITTAREMAKLFYNIDSTSIITNESKRKMADYLGHVKNNRLLQAGLPEDAILLHKTGDIGFMLGDAGIVKTANGKKYIVVIMARRPYNSIQGKEFIVKASEIIYNNIAYQ